ncbi:hypothetical protein EJB05_56076, partial [Eragrostis curvula]
HRTASSLTGPAISYRIHPNPVSYPIPPSFHFSISSRHLPQNEREEGERAEAIRLRRVFRWRLVAGEFVPCARRVTAAAVCRRRPFAGVDSSSSWPRGENQAIELHDACGAGEKKVHWEWWIWMT